MKNYQKKAVQAMRQYVPGEDMTGISVSPEDAKLPTLEGGFVAVNANNPEDKWYIAKKYHDENYVLVEDVAPTTFKDRLEIEKADLDEKLDKLEAFQKSDAFQNIEPIQMSLLNIQSHIMAAYSQTLLERIEWLQAKAEAEAN